ncbi:hypothetical protein HAX54_042227 [Datura stramonium]|uniref:Leucine-rich repeat-containing N-terminal plant-type domain-containing protein n=1 Tax=Datura stramonium TaxID=4076 RepID=A0ABS8W0X4_DATST|nr:hypothetical protein [Datura stramonium]
MGRSWNLLFALAVFILLHDHTSLANISTDEAALLQLKSHISSDPNNILASNWSSSGSVCSWIGITCSSRHSSYCFRHFLACNFMVPFLHTLETSRFLFRSDISNNTFHGDLPEELGHLRSNQFSGEIPSSLSNLTKLDQLILERNFLKGEIPREIGDLRYLTVLDLQRNRLTGSIPTSIFNITTMQIPLNKLPRWSYSTKPGEMQKASNIVIVSKQERYQWSLGSLPEITELGLSRQCVWLLSLQAFSTCQHCKSNIKRPKQAFRSTFSFLASLTNCRNLKFSWLSVNIRWMVFFRHLLVISQTHQSFEMIVELRGAIPKEIGNLQEWQEWLCIEMVELDIFQILSKAC